MAYEINCPVFKPFEWLIGSEGESTWPMLEDYCDDDEYYGQDAILRYLYDNNPRNLPEKFQNMSKAELIKFYKDNAPTTIANAMKKMADDIINGELKINFIFENYEQEHKDEA